MSARMLQGDVRDMLKTLPDESVHCVVTSPPYWGLRDYGVAGQIGMEPTMAEHLAVMVDVFREIRRVLRKDGTVWLNYGDCYAGSWGAQGQRETAACLSRNSIRNHPKKASHTGTSRDSALKAKDLCMIPNRLAIALQDDGWWVRSEIIWHKPNPMPESVTDRPATAHEKVWLLTKSARYFYDAEAVRRPMAAASVDRLAQDIDSQAGSDRAHAGGKTNGPMKAVGKGNAKTFRGGNYANGRLGERDSHGIKPNETGSANLRNVWTIPTKGFSGAHYATFPPDLIVPCIKAGCPPGGTVLDPFIGSGTTAMVADRLGRDCIGIDLNPANVSMAAERVTADAGLFAQVSA